MLDRLVRLLNVAGRECFAAVAERAGQDNCQFHAAVAVLGHRLTGRNAEQPDVGRLIAQRNRQVMRAEAKAPPGQVH